MLRENIGEVLTATMVLQAIDIILNGHSFSKSKKRKYLGKGKDYEN